MRDPEGFLLGIALLLVSIPALIRAAIVARRRYDQRRYKHRQDRTQTQYTYVNGHVVAWNLP